MQVAYGAYDIISYYLGNKYYPIPYDLKKGSYLSLSILFQPYRFMVSERIIMLESVY
jgi:hypothetical protein